MNPTRVDVIYDELLARLPEVELTYAAGFGIGTTEGDAELQAAALATASAADHVLLYLGLPAAAESEGFDRTHIDLPANQLALLDALHAAGVRPVVVLANGSSVRVSTWEHQAAAILECWLSGQAAGSAAAELVLGLANPSGKLAETLPVRLEDSSSFLNFPGDSGVVRYGEGIFIGYRGYDRARQEVSYPFGFGLSYTSFTIGDLALRTSGSVADDDLEVQATVTVVNIGAVAGAEVVQVYVCDVESTVARPVRELKAFAKVFLEPGESKQVSLVLDTRAFAYWSTRHHDWVVEAGEFEVAVGSSSRHLAARDRVHLEAPSVAPPLTGDSTLQEWVADDRGRELLSTLDVPILGDPELVRVIGTMPMRTLASFSGLLFDHGTLDRLEGQLEG